MKEAQAPGAAAAYAAKGLYDQRHHLVALIVTRVVVVAPVEGVLEITVCQHGNRLPAGYTLSPRPCHSYTPITVGNQALQSTLHITSGAG